MSRTVGLTIKVKKENKPAIDKAKPTKKETVKKEQ